MNTLRWTVGFRRTLAGVALAAILPAGARATTTTLPPQNHYQCYAEKPAVRFLEVSVSLVDQFGAHSADVVKQELFCNPVDKNGEGIENSTAHLMCYKIRREKLESPLRVQVANQFGVQTFTVAAPKTLCVPAGKDGVPLALPPTNHYQCYKLGGGDPKFIPVGVSLVDQYAPNTATVLKPDRLCNPVDKNGEGIPDPATHQLCYKIKVSSKLQPRVASVVDQFGQQTLTVKSAKLLCVPSTKVIIP